MILFRLGLAVQEKRRLTEVIEELVAPCANFLGVDPFGIAGETAHVCSRLKRTAASERIRLVAGLPTIDRLAHKAVALVVVNRRDRTVDRNLVKVWSTQTNQLRIGIREQTTLQQRIVGEIDSRHDVAGVKSDLLSFGKEVVGIAIERQLADASAPEQSLRE